jgi:glutamine phosphoribosylpyrophosphate amidotransferase
MCGIAGYFEKNGDSGGRIGEVLLRMLQPLAVRGPDSAGVAWFGPPSDHLLLRVKLGEHGDFEAAECEVLRRTTKVGSVHAHERTGAYLRLEVDADASVEALLGAIEDRGEYSPESIEVVSMGRRLQIVKQVGSPDNLEATYHLSSLPGSHGVGHTRLSTESRIDLSHSQPFWAHGEPDLAVVHNGHITNYHKLRRIYERQGTRFYTENDSEIIGIYLRRRLDAGDDLEGAMRASLSDLDGSFSYLAATGNAMGYVRDPFGLKPLVVAETGTWFAVATEEIALRRALGNGFTAREAAPRELRVVRG